MVAKAIAPDYALGSHGGALCPTFSSGMLLPDELRYGAFVGVHGSWNRNPPSGYKVVFQLDGTCECTRNTTPADHRRLRLEIHARSPSRFTAPGFPAPQ